MNLGRSLLCLAAFALTAFALVIHLRGRGSAVLAQAGNAVELEDTLFIVDPHFKLAKETTEAIDVLWIPKPIQKYCDGKTFTECSTIDFCIRTTTKSVAMCQNLPASLRHLPPYPAGMRPPRMFSITFSNRAPQIPEFDSLRQYYDSQPQGTFDLISMDARIKAKVRLTKNANGDNFELLEVLEAPAN